MVDLHKVRDYVSTYHCRLAAIIGGGYVAMKALESLYQFGLQLSIMHSQPRLCQAFDSDIANVISSELVKNVIQTHLGTKIQRIDMGVAEDGFVITLANEPSVPADLSIIATNLTLRTEMTEASGLACNHGVLVNEFTQTNDPGTGVGQRIDVLSVALQSGIAVFDLENLELSYAPEYGSARDPVNVVSMVAGYLLREDLHTITASQVEDHLDDWHIIDERSPENFAQGHIWSAVHISIDALRHGLASIDKGRPVVVYSRVGYHGYLAYRILIQLGYNGFNLDGNFKLLLESGTR